jgi:hypothetical protein
MPLDRLGRVTHNPSQTSHKDLKYLPWSQSGKEALSKYRAQQPSPEQLAKVDAYALSPLEYLESPHLRVRSLENELAHMYRTWLQAVEQTLDPDTARKVAYAAGLIHGTRRLGTFRKALTLPGGTETMAMWQDTAHASAGSKHTSALWVRYNEELVEVVRTEDSFAAHSGKEESEAQKAFFDGFIDGYKAADPSLSRVEEITRERVDGRVEYVHRFWYEKAR